MNWFLQQSLEYAAQRSYLDDLYHIYPTIPNGIRRINQKKWERVEAAYNSSDNVELIDSLLNMELFPVKDSYVAFLKKDRSALARNPLTVNRLASEIRAMGINRIYEKCSQPKESNRQMGPMFKNWIRKGELGFPVMTLSDFTNTDGNAILDASDSVMKRFAAEKLGYNQEKGIDFLARIKRHYIIGEAKFLTASGGHQGRQFNDAPNALRSDVGAIRIAILDGFLYIKSGEGMYKTITGRFSESNIMSALLLRNFLNAI